MIAYSQIQTPRYSSIYSFPRLSATFGVKVLVEIEGGQ